MKTSVIASILILCVASGKGQGIGSFFTQQDNKDKLMIEQIALQETYLSDIKKGYNATANGLNTAHDLKNGSFSLNQSYFNSLGQVSTAVRDNPKIKLVTGYQQQLISGFNKEISWQKQQAMLTGDEIRYVQQVCDNIISGCAKDLGELQMVITPGMAQMKDAERISGIDKLYTVTVDKYKFSMSFISNVHGLAVDRQVRKQNIQAMKSLYDTK